MIAPAERPERHGRQVDHRASLTVTDVDDGERAPGKAVAGFPADTVIYASTRAGCSSVPHLVVSGINAGQNVGPAVTLSGTIGAARTAAKRGIPAIAVEPASGRGGRGCRPRS